MARSALAFTAAGLSFAAFACMVISTLSVPIINSIYLIHVEAYHTNSTANGASLDLGVMGICGWGGDILTVVPKSDGNNCRGFGPGYSVFMPTPNGGTYSGNENSDLLFVVPTAACLTGLMTIFAVIASSLKRGRGITTTVLFGLVMLFDWVTFSLVAVVVGSAQSQIARRDSVELGIKTRSHLGATMFIILAGAILSTLAFGLSVRHTVVACRKARYSSAKVIYGNFNNEATLPAEVEEDLSAHKKLNRSNSVDSYQTFSTDPPQYDADSVLAHADYEDNKDVKDRKIHKVQL